ncbi:MAG TPA: PepSY-associated TM helix domain-containing protein [Methyloceanibacter sp.]|nr:PepSY-associated TM helix domain-containing protein [Methyloceanibacter sp.]
MCRRRASRHSRYRAGLGRLGLGQSSDSRVTLRWRERVRLPHHGAIRRCREQDGKPPSSPIPPTASRSARSSEAALPSQTRPPEIAAHNTICDQRCPYTARRCNLVESVAAPWSEFLARLHINLHIPPTYGLFIVGLTGVALLSSLISGLLSHPRIFRDAFSFRIGGSRRLQDADLHNRLGVWGLPFHIAVSLTGALLGLSVLIIGVLALAAYGGDSEKAFGELIGPQAGEDHTPASLPDLGAMISLGLHWGLAISLRTKRRAPGSCVSYPGCPYGRLPRCISRCFGIRELRIQWGRSSMDSSSEAASS